MSIRLWTDVYNLLIFGGLPSRQPHDIINLQNESAGVYMPWQYNADVITGILEEAGFDVIVTDTVQGIRDEGDMNYQVFINPKGRIRYQYSELLSHKTDTINIAGKRFDLDVENRDIRNIIGVLDRIEDLVAFLQNVPQILRKGERT
jgi:hypothetical protein